MTTQAARTVQAIGARRPQQRSAAGITATSPSNGWINPVQGASMPGPGSLYGDPRTHGPHRGVDLNSDDGMGSPIRAAADGTVSWIWSDMGGFGILIEHGNDWQTKYQHLGSKDQTVQPYAVPNGSQVRQGQIIGFMGDSGNANGPHLHYSMLHNGVFVDPMSTGFFTGAVNLDRIDDQVAPETAEARRTTLRQMIPELLSAASHVTAGGNRLSYAQILDERIRLRGADQALGSQDEQVM